jgi:hypothetical protein
VNPSPASVPVTPQASKPISFDIALTRADRSSKLRGMSRSLPVSIVAHLVAACLAAAGLAACAEDPADGCAEAYAHLMALAKRRPDPELASRFMASCVEVGDLGRVACLRAATTPGEALACKPQKKRPG